MSPMLQTPVRTTKGLFTQINAVNERPEGSLLEAKNATQDKQGVLSKPRGRDQFTTVGTAGDIDEIFYFKDKEELSVLANKKMYELLATVLSEISTGNDIERPAARHRVRATEMLQAQFLTTSRGIQKRALKNSSARNAGVPEALDLNASLDNGTGLGFFTLETQIAYRVVWKLKDSNGKELLGAPSWRQVLTNPKTAVTWARSGATITITQTAHGYANSDTVQILDSSDTAALPNDAYVISNVSANAYDITGIAAGGTSGTASAGKNDDVDVEFSVPDEISSAALVDAFYQVYRTALSADISTDPGDDMKLVEEVDYSSGSTVTYTDTLADAFLGENLYTNAKQEGLANQNNRPPHSIDMTEWKGHAWYIQPTEPHKLRLQFRTTSGISNGNSIVVETADGVTQRTYDFAAAEDDSMQEFQLFTAGTEAGNIANTMKSFCRVINRDSGQSLWYARYASQANDAPGFIEIVNRIHDTGDSPSQGLSAFSTTSAVRTAFSPVLGASSTAGPDSVAETKKNGFKVSKFEQPEAVPTGSAEPIGSESIEALRAFGLRDSLIVLTRQGIYRNSGDTDGATGATFVTNTEIDGTPQIICPDCAAKVNNAVFCLSTQGFLRIDEDGTEFIGWRIEDSVKEFFGVSLATLETYSWAYAYESENKYRCFFPKDDADTHAKFGFEYDYLYRQWFEIDRELAGAVIHIAEDKEYSFDRNRSHILQERKTFAQSGEDYSDLEVAVSVTALSTTTNAAGETVSTATFSWTAGSGIPVLKVGFFLYQTDADLGDAKIGSHIAAITDNGDGTFTVELEDDLSAFWDTTYVSRVETALTSRIRWAPEVAQNPAIKKQWSRVQVLMGGNTSGGHKLSLFNERQNKHHILRNPFPTVALGGWGNSTWGSSWGDEIGRRSTPLRFAVPREIQRSSQLSLVYEHTRARERFDIVNVAFDYRPYSSRTTRTPK